MQRAAIVKITEDGIVELGRDGGGSANQKGRFEVRPGGGVVWAPLTPGQETAEVPAAKQGLAPGELPQQPPPAVGHALGEASTAPTPPGSAISPPAGEAPAPPPAEAPTPPAEGKTPAPPYAPV